VRWVLNILLVFALAACAGDQAFLQGEKLIQQGRVEEGLEQLKAASLASPNNEEYRKRYQSARDVYVNELLLEADKARILGRIEDAAAGYAHALDLDPQNPRANTGLEAVAAEENHRREVAAARLLFEAGDFGEALEKVKAVLADNPSQRDAQALQRLIETEEARKNTSEPVLSAAYRKPVTLEFRDAPLKSIFEVLSKASGINFIFDRDVRPDLRATIFVRDTSIEDAVDFLLVTSQLDKKVLNHNSILVYPDLPNKSKAYKELVVKSFYLGNADVKQTLNLIKTLVKTRDVFIDERLNLLVMRDTPEAIALATKLIATQDLAQPEVILEVEVLEVSRSKLQELGIRYPSQLSYSLEGAAGVPGGFTLTEWLNNPRSELVNINVTDPAFIVNLRRQDGNTTILATPRIRVVNREKAKIHIGERLPVITTTSTANVGVSESVQYLDTGLKLDVEPNVYLNDEVLMKVGLEVSNVVQEVRSPNGTLTYQIGTRNTTTVLRVRNGETQVLAGLISETDRRTSEKVPGLANMPVLGRLFANNNDNRLKTEIVLLITPYIVRNIDRPGPAALEFASGTEGSLGAPRMRRQNRTARRLPSATGAARTSAGVTDSGTDASSDTVAAAQPTIAAINESTSGGATVALLLSAPLQVQAGREFAIAISVPPGAPSSPVQVSIAYDSSLLDVVGTLTATEGVIPLRFTGTATLRFRALEGRSGSASISIQNLVAEVPQDGPALTAPAPVQVNVVP
jgi:general secretion pathway protein D